MVTLQKEVYYRLVIWHQHFNRKTNTRWQLPWMIIYHPSEGHPSTQRWSPTNPRMVTHQKEVYYRLGMCIYTFLSKLTLVDNCHGWSPTIHRMVPHRPKDGHPLTWRWSPTRRKCTRQGICHLDLTHKTKTRWQLQWMVIHNPWEGHPPTQGWSPTRRKCTKDFEFCNYTSLTKLTPGDNCHGWSHTMPRRVSRQPKDDHPPEGSILQTWNLALKLYSQN